MDKKIIINDTIVEPGEQKMIRMPVARLHSGTRITLDINVYRSRFEGPTLLVLGGVHGDEINGVEIVRRTITSRMFERIIRGTVIVIPLLNIYGFINFSREVPDGKDVNRSFPGSKRGSLASRVAWILFKQILPLVDFGVDFHTGGASRFNYPQVRYTKQDEVAKSLAHAFAPPVIICNKAITKSLRNEARKLQKPIIVYEGGEALRFDGHTIYEGLDGLQRLLKSQGMLNQAPEPNHKPLVFKKAVWQRASRSGIFVWEKSSGIFVKRGDLLGNIYEPHGRDQTPIYARKNGFIIGHNNAPVVNQGDALFHIALEDDINDNYATEPDKTD